MSVDAFETESEAASLLEIEADLGLIEVGSHALKFSRAVLRTLHQFKRSSRVSAIRRLRMVVRPCFLSYKKYENDNKSIQISESWTMYGVTSIKVSIRSRALVRNFIPGKTLQDPLLKRVILIFRCRILLLV